MNIYFALVHNTLNFKAIQEKFITLQGIKLFSEYTVYIHIYIIYKSIYSKFKITKKLFVQEENTE